MWKNRGNKRATSQSPGGPGGSQTNPNKKDRLSAAGDDASSIVEENEDSSQLGNLSKDQISQIASGHAGNGTYAGAASKPEVDIKHLVYIQKGQEKRETIAKPLFLAFMSKLNEDIWGLPEDQFEKINIDWSDHDLGRGLIASLDPETTAFIKKAAETFNYEGQTLRGWTRDEFGTQTVYQGFLHNIIWQDYKAPRAISMILKKNGLLESGKFQDIAYQKHRKGVFTRFECDSALSAAIDSHGLSLRAGICRLVLAKKVIIPKVVSENSAEGAAAADATAASSNETTEKQSTN